MDDLQFLASIRMKTVMDLDRRTIGILKCCSITAGRHRYFASCRHFNWLQSMYRCIDSDGEKFRVDPQAESRTYVAAVFVEASKPNRRWAKERIFSAGLVFYTLRDRTNGVNRIGPEIVSGPVQLPGSRLTDNRTLRRVCKTAAEAECDCEIIRGAMRSEGPSAMRDGLV